MSRVWVARTLRSMVALVALTAVAHAASRSPFGSATPSALHGPLTPAVRLPAGTGSTVVLSQDLGNEYLLLGSAFDRADGSCQTSAWQAEDLTTQLFAHLTDRVLVNAEFASWEIDGSAALPQSADRFALGFTTAIARTDSGGVRILQYPEGNRLADRWVVAYPGAKTVRELEVNASLPQLGFASFRGKADLDPLTQGTVVTDANQGFIHLLSRDGLSRTTLAGGGSSFVDGPADQANLNTTTLAVAPNGDIYFADQVTLLTSLDTRLRMLRRADQQIITLATPATVPPEGPFGLSILGQVRGIAFGPAGELYLNDDGFIRRADLQTHTIQTLSGRIATDGLEYSGGALYFSHALFNDTEGGSAPRTLVRFDLTTLQTTIVVGSEAYGATPVGTGASGRLGTQNPFPSFGQTAFGMDADGSGGLYFAAGGAAYHLLANGELELLAGRTRAMRMGSHAVRFGADSLSAPAQTRNWVGGSGWGNSWSQRLQLPAYDGVANPGAVVEFDLALWHGGPVPRVADPFDGNSIVAQARAADGRWIDLDLRLTSGSTGTASQPPADSSRVQPVWRATGLFHARISMADQVLVTPLAAPVQLRLVLNTSSTNSAEDGFGPDVPAAAIVDNIVISQSGNVIASADFEDGTLQGCQLSARNNRNSGAAAARVDVHDQPAGSVPRVVSGFDANLTSCLWTFTGNDGLMGSNALARLESPWIAIPRRDTSVTFELRGKLPAMSDLRTVTPWVRVKHTGDIRPRAFGAGLLSFTNGLEGVTDADAPVSLIKVSYPQDFQFPLPTPDPLAGPTYDHRPFDPVSGADSLQIVWLIEDRVDEQGDPLPRNPSKLPILDELKMYQLNADTDQDGIADRDDACTATTADGLPGGAAGQDADGDGCLDETATLQHAESWSVHQYPIHYVFNAAGDPANPSGESLSALRNAFAVWAAVPGAQLPFVEDAPTTLTRASATDGVNLVTFQDPDFDFSDGAIAITPTMSFDQRVSFHDRIVQPGEIVDADIVFNPAFTYGTPRHPGAIDLASVAQHEIGHLLGISHSGATDATMYFVLQPGTSAATLTADDEAAVAAAYPSSFFASSFGTLTGRVTRGSNGASVPGALVRAFRLDANGAPLGSAATDYTREDGRYALRRLAPGTYGVFVTPLDGDVDGNPLEPAVINSHVARIAETNFQEEWRSNPESASDDATLIEPLTVAAGQKVANVDIVTNIDVIPPRIVTSFPLDQSTGVRIDSAMLLKFSEPVDGPSLGRAFKLRRNGVNIAGGSSNALTNAGRTFMLTPPQTLDFDADYVLEVTTELADREGVPLAQTFQAAFHTEAQPAVAITDIQPRTAAPGTFVTVTGAGFDRSLIMSAAVVRATGAVDTVSATQVTPTTAVIKLPAGAPALFTGDIRMVRLDMRNDRLEASNTFHIDLRQSTPPANPVLLSSTPLSFSPLDVAVAPDGLSAIAVGPDGMATVVYAPAPATTATVVPRLFTDGQHILRTADGLRAFVSRPNAQEVVEIDANPASASFGAVRRTMPVAMRADGLALSPSGRLLYVTPQDSAGIAVLDVDPLSSTLGEIRSVIGVGNLRLTGGISVTKDGSTLALTSESGAATLWLTSDGLAATVTGRVEPTAACQDAVVISEGDDLMLYARRDGTVQIAHHDVSNGMINNSPHVPQSSVPLSGDVSDLAIVPFRRTLLATNRALNLLQVVTLDSTDQAVYLTKLSDVPTNRGPAAVGVDGVGTTAIVACGDSRTLERYTMASGRPLRLLVNSMAIPGDLIAVTTDGGSQTVDSRVSIGNTLVPFSNLTDGGSGGAFVVPATTPRGDVGVSISSPGDSARTFTRALRVFDPGAPTNVRSAGLQGSDGVFSGCVSTPGGAYLASGMRISPDGRLLGVLAYAAGRCRAMVDVYQITDEGPAQIGSQLTRLMFGTGVTTLDFDFSADSRQLYVTDSDGVFTGYDVDPASPTFGNVLASQSAANIVAPYGLAVDPMGRFIWLASPLGAGAPLNGLSPTAPYTIIGQTAQSTPLHALAPSRDGRWVLGGAEGQTFVYNQSPGIIANVSTPHPGTGFIEHYAITGDGQRALALHANGSYSVLSLEVATVGQEQFFGTLPGGLPAFDATLGPTPTTVLVSTGTGAGRDVYLIDLATTPPVVTPLGISNGLGYIAMSPDHRSLWSMDETQEFSRLVRHEFHGASTMTVLSGADQIAAPGARFPTPVRVQLTDPQGRPQAGVEVRFNALDGRGSLERAPSVPLREALKLTDANGEATVVWFADLATGAPQQVRVSVPVLGLASDVVLNANSVGSDSQTPPVVTSAGPTDGASGILAHSEMFVQFNQAMDLTTFQGALTLTANGQPVQGTLRSELAGRLVFFRPTTQLPYQASCVLSLAAGVLDTDGQALATGLSLGFTVQGPPLLAIAAASPPAAAVGTPVTLSGAGFNPAPSANSVVLAGTVAPVLSASSDALVIRVPAGANSGDLTVQTGGIASPPISFTVLAPDTVVGAIIADLPSGSGVQAIAISPDGERAYAANVRTNSVQALDLKRGTTITNVIVGLQPVMLAVTPSGQRVYVVNRGSNDVSVIDTDPASPTYHKELKRIHVGLQPVAVSIARDGSLVAVACKGDSSVYVIDARAGSPSRDRVTKSATVAAGSQAIAVSADGTRIYVGTSSGVSILDLRSGAVTKSATVAAGTQAIAVSADGAFLFVLSKDGRLLVVDVTPGSTNENKVVKSATVAAGSQTIAVSADGAKLFVTDISGHLLVYTIQISGAGAPVLLVPGASVSLTLQHEFTVGAGAMGIGVDPRDGFVLVANSVAGTITQIGVQTSLPPVAMGFDFKPHTLNLRSHGRFVEAELYPPTPYTAKDIDVASVRIEGVVPVSRAESARSSDDEADDERGRARLKLKFDRLAIETLLLPGERVPIHVTGLVAGRPFEGADTVRVVRGRVRSPHEHDRLQPGGTHLVAWDSPDEDKVKFVNLVITYDQGASWRTLASHLPNSGQWAWNLPDTLADSVRVCVLLAEGDEDVTGYAPGMVATSMPFRIVPTTDAPRDIPGRLSLSRPSPNPARRGNTVLRFGLPAAGEVQLELYDLMGRRVRSFVTGRQEAGWHTVRWNGELNGALARPGLYFVRLRSNGQELRQPLIWLE